MRIFFVTTSDFDFVGGKVTGDVSVSVHAEIDCISLSRCYWIFYNTIRLVSSAKTLTFNFKCRTISSINISKRSKGPREHKVIYYHNPRRLDIS